jgi:hypothetical protein
VKLKPQAAMSGAFFSGRVVLWMSEGLQYLCMAKQKTSWGYFILTAIAALVIVVVLIAQKRAIVSYRPSPTPEPIPQCISGKEYYTLLTKYFGNLSGEWDLSKPTGYFVTWYSTDSKGLQLNTSSMGFVASHSLNQTQLLPLLSQVGQSFSDQGFTQSVPNTSTKSGSVRLGYQKSDVKILLTAVKRSPPNDFDIVLSCYSPKN